MNSGSGQDNRKMKKRIAVAIVSTLLVILSLYAVNAVILGQQKTKQLEISRTLLHYSEDLSQNVALGLKSITTQGVIKPALIATDK
jgi:cytoskeletal protein RodZ